MNKFLPLLMTTAFFLSLFFSFSTDAVINVKGGLAGGAGLVAGEMTRTLNEKTDLKAEAGIGVGNNGLVLRHK